MPGAGGILGRTRIQVLVLGVIIISIVYVKVLANLRSLIGVQISKGFPSYPGGQMQVDR